MTSFSATFPDTDIIQALGDDLIYKRGSKKLPIKGVVEEVGANIYIEELHFEASFLQSAIALVPQRGDLIIGNNRTYTVDMIINTDDSYYKLVVR